jgi:hypothetical protein
MLRELLDPDGLPKYPRRMPLTKDGYDEYYTPRTWPELMDDIVIPISPCTLNGITYTTQNISLAPTTPNQTISFKTPERPALTNHTALPIPGAYCISAVSLVGL